MQVSYEDVERLKSLAVMENVRIPHFLQDQEFYTKQLQKIMTVNQLTDEELQGLIWTCQETPVTSDWTPHWPGLIILKKILWILRLSDQPCLSNPNVEWCSLYPSVLFNPFKESVRFSKCYVKVKGSMLASMNRNTIPEPPTCCEHKLYIFFFFLKIQPS